MKEFIMKNKRKWISKAALSLGVLTMLGGVGLGAGSSVYAAKPDQNISGNSTSDNTSKRSITIWKYEINSSAELGERGDGESLDPASAPDLTGKKLMAGVNFEIVKVTPKEGVSLTDPLSQTEANGDYTIDSKFTKQTDVTGDGTGGTTLGALTFDVGTGKAADGIYLVREIPDSNGEYTYTDENGDTKKITKPMDPFFVHLPQTKRDDTGKLIYDVHVYPKNIVTDTELDKTIEGGKGYSIKAGNSFKWEATTKLPDGLYALAPREMTIPNYVDPDTGVASDKKFAAGDEIYASYFRVSDSIDENLLLEDAEVYAIASDGSKVKLTNGTEYTVTLDGTTISNPNKVEDLTEGSKKNVVVSLTKAGMKKLGEDADTHLQVVYKVNTNKDFNGTISNQYRIDYLLPGGTPDEGTSDVPESYSGGFDILKTEEDKTSTLEGAEFHIATSEADANAKKYLASDGKSYTLNDDGTSTPALPTGVTYVKATSGSDGKAEFNGLELDWFTDSNGNGKQDPTIPAEATWDKVYDKDAGTGIHRKYWVVETKAPDGYELLRDPQEVTVTLSTADDALVEVPVINKKKTDLPFTGGAGMTLMIVIALGAIVVGTATMAIEKKRRQSV